MTLKEVANLILQHNNFDILTHNYPDGDCIGSAFALAHALKQIGKKRARYNDRPPEEVRVLIRELQRSRVRARVRNID